MTDFASDDGAEALESVLIRISDLLQHLDVGSRKTLLGTLTEKATLTLTSIVDDSDDARLIQLPLKEWVAAKHIPATADHYFKLLQLKSVVEVAALSDGIVTDIAHKLKFVEAWWFERGMAATKAAFKEQQQQQGQGQHSDEL